MGPLPKGVGHIMRMALFAPKFGYLDLTRKSILFLSPPSGGESLIRVTTTSVTSISSATMPLTKRLLRGRGISGYPFLVRGVVRVDGCPSHRGTRGKACGWTAPCQSIPCRVVSMSVIRQGQWQGSLWLERSSCRREGRVQPHRGEPVLEIPVSSPPVFLL